MTAPEHPRELHPRARARGVASTLLALCALLAFSGAAAAEMALSVGSEFRTGDYGTGDDIEDIYAPVSLDVLSGQLLFQLTVPYVHVDGPAASLIGPGDVLPGGSDNISEGGLGDVVASVTLRDLYRSYSGDFAVDLTGTVKLGTGDEDNGLGTGETDYAAQVDVYRFLDAGSVFGSLGYKIRTDPSGYDLRNTWFAQAGASREIRRNTSLGASLSYRPKAISYGDPASELTVFGTQTLNRDLRVTGYVLAGLADGSPDWGAGFSVKHWF
ncbi:MAG: hypothetical protein R3E86_12660 [Pseudomonadales bacterium]